MVKHLYLVRHGETADNRAWVHQSIDVALDAKGKEEAAAAARALALLPIDTIITSDAERAQETAAPLAAVLGRTPIVEPALRELHRGVLLEGEHHLSWKSIKGSALMFLRAGNSSWHFGDGENVIEFRDRLLRILAILAEAPGEHVVAVTHRGVINGLRYGLAHGFEVSPRTFILSAVFGKTKNASITELTYDPSRAEPWQVVRANDTRHLRGL